MFSKSSLAIRLSKLKVFDDPELETEQYPTDSEIAADLLWNVHMIDGLEGKHILDLGCGTGIIGIGALLLGAAKVTLLDKSKEALKLLKTNVSALPELDGRYDIIESDIREFNGKADIVIMNPPFGTKTKHADKGFLEVAFASAPVVYSFHKTSTRGFLKAMAKDHSFRITHTWDYRFPIKATHRFHNKPRKDIEVTALRFLRG